MSLRTLYDEASLWMTPGGYEDGKLFSELPTDGSGDFTFSRGSNLAATRVGPTGLIEKGRENLALYSNTFSSWNAASGGSVTSGQLGYDGTNDAWLLTSGSSTYSRIERTIAHTGVYTISVYAKAGTLNWLSFENSGITSDETYFDLVNGTTGTDGSNVVHSSIESVGDGWYRCSATFNGTSNVQRIYPAVRNGDLNSAQGNIYIQDFQFEAGLVATDYIETGASTAQAGILEDMPRLDYSGGASCPALLLEPQRTNVVESSEYFQDDYWANLGIHQFDTNTTATTSPMGDYSATKIVADTSSSSNHNVYGDVSLSSGTQYAVSIFAKAAEYDYLFIRGLGLGASGGARFNIATGVVEGVAGYDSATIEDYGNGWYRCIAIGTSISTTAPYYHMSPTSSFAPFAGNDSDGIYIWGAQCEQGSYPTSYIPTYGSSVTRSYDSSILGSIISNGIITNEQFTFMVHLKVLGRAINTQIYLTDIGGNRIVSLNTQSTNQVGFYSPDGAAYVSSDTFTTDSVKVALSYNGSEFVQYTNGVKTGTLSISITEVINGIIMANTILNAIDIKQMLLFPEALSDTECIELTINGLKEDLITAYKTRATTLEAGAEDRLDTYLQQLEDFIIV